MTHDEENTLLEQCVDEASLIAFIRHLADERWELERRGHHGDWEHGTIGTYLDAVAAAYEDGVRPEDNNPWQRAARILLAGKYYE